MEHVISSEDIPSLKKEYQSQEILSGQSLVELFGIIDAIVSHPDLYSYFSPGLNVLNERDIITKEGEVLRPDRVVFHNDHRVAIIDYKTGAQSEAHAQQINRYAEALQEMGYLVGEKLLVYCSHEKIEINKA
jgi:ATP-dependent exoDNAse (exonuclease V) beta subunit